MLTDGLKEERLEHACAFCFLSLSPYIPRSFSLSLSLSVRTLFTGHRERGREGERKGERGGEREEEREGERERGKEREGKRERGIEREGEGERERESGRENYPELLLLCLKGMMGALAPFSYLVHHNGTTLGKMILGIITFSKNLMQYY
jgi:hypothetical protein